MSKAYQINDQEALHFLTFQIVEWVDVFTRKIYKDIMIDSFKYVIENKDFQLFAYVIMSNHVHLVAHNNTGKLSENIRDIKKYTSIQIVQALQSNQESRRSWMLNRFKHNASQTKRNKTYQVWTHENHAVILYSNKFIQEKIEYIHNNPVRAGIVKYPEDYLYSSARNYASLDAPIDIPVLFMPWHTYK